MSEIVHLTIDGRPVEVPRGTLLVEAAKTVGIEIPIFCYHSKLKPVGACRMCLVEIEKMPRLQTACTSPVAEGMVVNTTTPTVEDAQNGVLELLLANHPLDCPICDRGGECPLQDNAFTFGRGTSRFRETKRRLGKALPLSDRIVLDRERCIMCYRCVRFQDEVVGDQALATIDRGGQTAIGVLDGETFDSPFSGNTVDLCPVGALLSRQYRFRARPWDLRRTPSVCMGCAVGCNTEIHARDGAIQRMIPRENMAVNNAWLCDYGRYDTLPLGRERVREPSVDGRRASWDEALMAAATRLRQGSAEVVASPALTNEALSALRAIARELRAPLSVWPATTGRLRGTIEELVASKTIVLIDFDPWDQLPILALRIREALKTGAKLYVIGSGPNGLRRDTARTFATVEDFLATFDALPGPVSILGSGAETLRERLQAAGTAVGMVGSPALAANGWAMADLPAARFDAPALLLAGNERWPAAPGRQEVRLRWEAADISSADMTSANMTSDGTVSPAASSADDAGRSTSGDILSQPLPLDGGGARPAERSVVLPIAHPYEQSGSVTNFEGRVQALRPGGQAPAEARPDWLALAELARVLGASPAGPREREIALA
ncbi:MAG: 2Fe-2S iron-sulfur cluster-binding protein [Chloroflexota bacterium]